MLPQFQETLSIDRLGLAIVTPADALTKLWTKFARYPSANLKVRTAYRATEIK